MMAAKKPTIMRVRIAREELEKMSKEDLHKCWNLQDQYVDLLENKLNTNSEHTELLSLRESEEKLKQQQLEASRRENILVMRLTTKEHEMQDLVVQNQELKQAQVPSIAQLRSALLDPAVNLLFERMRKEMDSLKARLEETQNELSAWKFTPDSNTGKRLMSKCRLLYQENEELGKIISSGRMAKLEGDLALQKNFSEEMKKSQSELDEFLLELDEDVEGMQSTIYYLQQQLREAKDQIQHIQKVHCIPLVSNSSPVNQSNDLCEVIISRKSFSETIKEENKPSVISIPKHNGTETNTVEIPIKSSFATSINEIELTKKANLSHEPLKQSERFSKSPTRESDSVLEVKNLVNHENDISQPEQINTVDNDTERTNENVDGSNNMTQSTENSSRTDDSFENLKSNKRTSDSSRGRKRTRPRTPIDDSISEENLPMRKRTRHREMELKKDIEEHRTEVEIDTDTEVQVAQTLASWASTKQERTEMKKDLDNSLGNGEIKQNYNDVNDS